MGRLDVLKSLVRSTARRAAERIGELELGEGLKDFIQHATLRRMVVSEAQLTAAVGRLAGVQAATVSISADGVGVQVSNERGQELSLTLRPQGASFAPRGAKELTFEALPPEAAEQPLVSEVFGAIATEVAHTLWATVLPRVQSAHQVFVHRSGSLLSADLRTVPGLRQALHNPVATALVDTLRLNAVTTEAGRLQLHLGIEGMP